MYLAANGIIMGKAALDELQDGGNSVNPTNQYTDGLITTMLNAYNQTRIAGGRLHALQHLLALARFFALTMVDPAVARLDLQGMYTCICMGNARWKRVMGMIGASPYVSSCRSLCR